MNRALLAIRHAAVRFYPTWLLYVTFVGIPIVVLLYLLTLLYAVLEGVCEFFDVLCWKVADHWPSLRAFACSFTPTGWRARRDAR